jgi:hypothetical protein
MNTRQLLSMTAGLLMGTIGFAAETPAAPVADQAKPGVFEAAAGTLTATVVDIDYTNRMVTLKDDKGSIMSMQVGPEAVRFNEVKKGDVVQIDYLESVGVVVTSPSDTIATAQGSSTVMVRNKGKKPSGEMVTTDVVTATVVKINAKTRKATLKGPNGNEFVIDVAPDVQNLQNVKKGDQVLVKYTRTLAIDVRKPGAKK